ncbi:DUF6783 domain-containing protein, partial [Robinsoniella sp.]
TKCDAQLPESNFKTRSSTALHKYAPKDGSGQRSTVKSFFVRARSLCIDLNP